MHTSSKTIRTRAAVATVVGLLAVGGVAAVSHAAESPTGTTFTTQDVEDPDSHESQRNASATTRLTEALAPLVDDGTLTQEQADTVVSTLAETRGDKGGGGGGRSGGQRGAGLEAAAEVLGLTPEELREQVADGDQTLAQVAVDQGVDSQNVIDALVASATERIEAGVADGRLGEAQAQERLAEVTERVTSLVEEGPQRDERSQQDNGDQETEQGA